MKKLVALFLLMVVSTTAHAFNPRVWKGKQDVTATTTAQIITLTKNGYVTVFANGGKVYFTDEPTGVTANATDKYLVDGGEIDTGDYYFAGDKWSFLADSTTVNIKIDYHDYLRR